MSTKHLASIWSNFGPDTDGKSRDAWADLMIANVCGQNGYLPDGQHEAINPWKSARKIKPRQTQYVAWNSQLMPTNPAIGYMGYAYNPIPFDHPRIPEWILRGSPYMDPGAPGYAEAWATNAVKLARKWEKLSGNHWSGIFADSICYGFWFPNIAKHYGTIANYRGAQERFCAVVGSYLHKRGFKFGANVGVGSPGYAAWPAIFENLDLAFMEHVYPDLTLDAAILDRTRKYALAVHADSRLSSGEYRDAEIDVLAKQLGKLLGSNDYVTFGTSDAGRIAGVR